MKFLLFRSAGLVALKQNKWSLYSYVHAEDGKKASLLPLNFAQNVDSLMVYEDLNIVTTPEGVFSTSGQVIFKQDTIPSEHKMIGVGNNHLLIVAESKGRTGMQLIVWDGEKVCLNVSCTGYTYSKSYLALKFGHIWRLYDINGTLIDDVVFKADDVEIHGRFLVINGLANHDLYSIKERKFLKLNMLKVVCSNTNDLALCADISNKVLNVWSSGKWYEIADAEDFGVIEGLEHLFYVKRKGKYFLYTSSFKPFMEHSYPDGMDFVAYNRHNLFIINNGEPAFYSEN